MIEKFQDLKKRVLVSFVLISICFFVLYFIHLPVVRALFVLVLALVASAALWEYIHMVKKQVVLPTKLLIFAAILEVGSFYVVAFFSLRSLLPGFIFLLFVFAVFIQNFSFVEGSLSRIVYSIFGFLYIIVPISLLIPLLFLEQGRLYLIYIIVVTKMTDIGGYFGGKLFGKNPLALKISPAKTIEGAVFGFLFATTSSFLMCHYFAIFSLYHSLLLGMVFGIFGQLGDLAESLIKRNVFIKDSNVIPGMGGMLDLVDSLLWNIPVFYFFVI